MTKGTTFIFQSYLINFYDALPLILFNNLSLRFVKLLVVKREKEKKEKGKCNHFCSLNFIKINMEGRHVFE